METRELLEQVKSGKISIEEAESYFKREPFEEMGYAKLDMHREVRSGFPEVIFCSGKADEHLLHIVGKLYEKNGEVFGTRASVHQYELVKEKFPVAEYDPISGILKIDGKKRKKGSGCSVYGRNSRYCSGRRSSTDGRILWNESRASI